MRILIVAMVDSIHTTRWIEQFDDDADKNIYAFSSSDSSAKRNLRRWPRVYGELNNEWQYRRALCVHLPFLRLNSALHLTLNLLFGNKWRTRWLVKTIRRLKPDIVHSLEFQHAGYLCLDAKRKFGKDFPTWIATNWGSDIYLFSELEDHIDRIRGVLKEADFYSAECERDYALARTLGMQAIPLPVIPNAGGLHIGRIETLGRSSPPSQRKTILIKGYQMAFGRAATALRAIELIADQLKQRDIYIAIFSVTADIKEVADSLAERTGLKVNIHSLSQKLSHEDMLALQARARCYVGISISDGISTSMLEAMAMGAFPIQTCTSCANEWFEDGVTGFLAPSVDDHHTLSQLILRAVIDDNLVDSAAERNWETIKQRANWDHVRTIAQGFYDTAIRARGARA